MSRRSAEILDKIRRYQRYLEKDDEGEKDKNEILSILTKLDKLSIGLAHLQETGIGKTVNGFRKHPSPIGELAKSLVAKWKMLVQAALEESEGQEEEESDQMIHQDQPPRIDEYSRKDGNKRKSDYSQDEVVPKKFCSYSQELQVREFHEEFSPLPTSPMEVEQISRNPHSDKKTNVKSREISSREPFTNTSPKSLHASLAEKSHKKSGHQDSPAEHTSQRKSSHREILQGIPSVKETSHSDQSHKDRSKNSSHHDASHKETSRRESSQSHRKSHVDSTLKEKSRSETSKGSQDGTSQKHSHHRDLPRENSSRKDMSHSGNNSSQEVSSRTDRSHTDTNNESLKKSSSHKENPHSETSHRRTSSVEHRKPPEESSKEASHVEVPQRSSSQRISSHDHSSSSRSSSHKGSSREKSSHEKYEREHKTSSQERSHKFSSRETASIKTSHSQSHRDKDKEIVHGEKAKDTPRKDKDRVKRTSDGVNDEQTSHKDSEVKKRVEKLETNTRYSEENASSSEISRHHRSETPQKKSTSNETRSKESSAENSKRKDSSKSCSDKSSSKHPSSAAKLLQNEASKSDVAVNKRLLNSNETIASSKDGIGTKELHKSSRDGLSDKAVDGVLQKAADKSNSMNTTNKNNSIDSSSSVSKNVSEKSKSQNDGLSETTSKVKKIHDKGNSLHSSLEISKSHDKSDDKQNAKKLKWKMDEEADFSGADSEPDSPGGSKSFEDFLTYDQQISLASIRKPTQKVKKLNNTESVNTLSNKNNDRKTMNKPIEKKADVEKAIADILNTTGDDEQMEEFSNFIPQSSIISKNEKLHTDAAGRRQYAVPQMYSGKKSAIALSHVPTLLVCCQQVLSENIDALEHVGVLPYELIEPILKKCTPEQLENFEYYNAQFVADTEPLWKFHTKRNFPGVVPGEFESWRELYFHQIDERKAKLNRCIQTLSASVDKVKKDVHKVKFIDTVAPPRQVRRQQQKYNTAVPIRPQQKHSQERRPAPSSSSSSSSKYTSTLSSMTTTSMLHDDFRSKQKAVKIIPPMMQKVLKLTKNMRR